MVIQVDCSDMVLAEGKYNLQLLNMILNLFILLISLNYFSCSSLNIFITIILDFFFFEKFLDLHFLRPVIGLLYSFGEVIFPNFS